jgi:DNA-binding response OmpR family regulator
MQLPRVLLVEDDRSIASALVQALQTSYRLSVAQTGRQAIQLLDDGIFDAVILDLGLPDMDGLAVCRQLRANGSPTPLLVLTAEDKVLTKIHLLDAGANDYLLKPFSLGELKARLRVLLRPPRSVRPLGKLTVNGLELDRRAHEVSRDGIPIKLRPKEFALLEYLMEHAGSVASRRALSRYAWPEVQEIWTNTVDVHIKHLRDKIDRPFRHKLIQTVHGVGYKLVAKSPGTDEESQSDS